MAKPTTKLARIAATEAERAPRVAAIRATKASVRAEEAAAKAPLTATEKLAKKRPLVTVAPRAPKPKANLDTIVATSPSQDGKGGLVVKAGVETMTIDHKLISDRVLQLAKVGASMVQLQQYLIAPKARAKLANGVTAMAAPHSAKAVADGAAKGPAPKAPRAKAAPASARKITVVDKAFVYGAAGTMRRASWDAIAGSATTADYAAKGGKAKYLARWEAAGAIKLG